MPKAVSITERFSPKKRKDAKSAARLIGRPKERKDTREFVIVPDGGKKTKVRIFRVVSPPEERKNPIIRIIRIKLRYRPKDIVLIILAHSAFLVLRIKRPQGEMIAAERYERPGYRTDRLAPIRYGPKIDAIFDRARVLYGIAFVKRRRRKLLHRASAQQRQPDSGYKNLLHFITPFRLHPARKFPIKPSAQNALHFVITRLLYHKFAYLVNCGSWQS